MTSGKFRQRSRGLIGACAVIIAAALPATAMAQLFHGAAVQKQCQPLSKVGDTTDCLIRVSNIDEFGDTVRVIEGFDIVDVGGDDVRVPGAGNLPIVSVDVGVTCAAGPSLPCDIPGTAQGGGSGLGVIFQSNTYVIQPDDPDPLPDQGRSIVQDLCDGPNTAGCSSIANQVQFTAATQLFQPAIAATKVANPTTAKVGDPVDYTITLSNNSSPDTPPLTCTATDSLGGVVFGPAQLPPGDTQVGYQRNVQAGDPDPVVNTVTLDCSVEGFTNTLSDSASASVDVFDVAIDVAKVANPTQAKAGDPVDYTITLSNNSSADTPPLTCTATDSLGGVVFGPAQLPPGDTQVGYQRNVQAGDPNPLVNTVTLDCSVDGFPNTLSDSASAEVTVFGPAIDVAKVANPTQAKAGDPVDYTITLSNNSTPGTPPLICTANDSLGGVVFGPAQLPPGDTQVGYQRNVQAGDPDPVVNTVTLDCSVEGFTNTLSDSASAEVTVFGPAIDVAKVANPTQAKVGDPVDYTITLSNNSTPGTPPLICTANDSLGGVVFGPAQLPPGDTQVGYQRNVQAGDPDPVVNTVTLDCSVEGFTNTLSDSASAEVTVFGPAIDVAKVANPTQAKVGDPVDYTITLSNNSTPGTPPLICTANDSLGGVVFGPAQLPPGDTQVGYQRNVQAGDPDPVVNTVTLDCSVEGFTNTLSDSASAEVDLVNPDFEITKECAPDPVGVGETITWTIGLENTGDTELVICVDDAVANIDECMTLGVGGTDEITAERLVVAEDAPEITNVAEATATPTGLTNEITKDATSTCEVEVGEGCVFRTPGFWCTHDEVADQFLPVDSCGLTVDNSEPMTPVSSTEDLQVGNDFKGARDDGSDTSPQQLQLIRQCTAAGLNASASQEADGSCDNVELSNGETFEEAFGRCCTVLCTSGASGPTISESGCIELIDEFNNLEPDTLSCDDFAADPPAPGENPWYDVFCPSLGANGFNASPEECSAAKNNGYVNPGRNLGPRK